MLSALPPGALPLGVFWVSENEPNGSVREWLDAVEDTEVRWVPHKDFDEFMVLIHDTFKLDHPSPARFNRVFKDYFDKYSTLSSHIATLPDSTPGVPELKAAAGRVSETFPDWTSVVLEAQTLRDTDPKAARETYEKGIQQFPDEIEIHLYYGSFLALFEHDFDGAEKAILHFLAKKPNDPSATSTYAYVLGFQKDRHEQAQEMFEHLFSLRSDNANDHLNYCGFLLASNRRDEGLEKLRELKSGKFGSIGLAMQLEIDFYTIVHEEQDLRPEAMARLKRMLVAGVRSQRWNFDLHLSVAEEGKREDLHWLVNLAGVIAGTELISTLDGWIDWETAVA